MGIGFSLQLKVSGIAGILLQRGAIDNDTFNAICRYNASGGDYESIARTYETSRSLGRGTRTQCKLVHQQGYFKEIERIVQDHILPSAQKASWCDLFVAQRRTDKIVAKRKDRADNFS